MSRVADLTHIQPATLNEVPVEPLVPSQKPRAVRHLMLRSCSVVYYPNSPISLHTISGRTHNISKGGVGLQVAHVFLPGDPIEVEITKEGQQFYLSGLVAFCRHRHGMDHEVGVRLFTAGHDRSLRTEFADPRSVPDWVREALLSKHSCDPMRAPELAHTWRAKCGRAA